MLPCQGPYCTSTTTALICIRLTLSAALTSMRWRLSGSSGCPTCVPEESMPSLVLLWLFMQAQVTSINHSLVQIVVFLDCVSFASS